MTDKSVSSIFDKHSLIFISSDDKRIEVSARCATATVATFATIDADMPSDVADVADAAVAAGKLQPFFIKA